MQPLEWLKKLAYEIHVEAYPVVPHKERFIFFPHFDDRTRGLRGVLARVLEEIFDHDPHEQDLAPRDQRRSNSKSRAQVTVSALDEERGLAANRC